MLCDALRDLDVRFRAVVSIVNDWREAADEQQKVDESKPLTSPSSVEKVWDSANFCKLLVQVLESSRRMVDICKSTAPTAIIDEGEAGQVRGLLEVYVKSMRSFPGAISDVVSILSRYSSQDADSTVALVHGILEELTESTKRVEEYLELLEWEELNRQALSPAEFKQLAAYLLKTGKASA